MAGLLDGVKVLSMELMEAVPAASVWLADWGADVTKIEPLTGDQFRGTRRIQGASAYINIDGAEVNPRFELLNRGKKSIAVDLKQDAGREIVYKMVKDADIFMTNNEEKALLNLKMDYPTLKKINPKIIYGFLNAYGTKGPDKDGPGYDRVAAWARGGFQHLVGEPGAIPPSQRSGMMDRAVATNVVAGVMAALYAREKTGKGEKIEVSLFQSAVWILSGDIQVALVAAPLAKDDRSRVANPLWSTYKCKDDRWICLGMLRPDPFWEPLCKALARKDLLKDPRFDSMENRRINNIELIEEMDATFAKHNVDYWEKRCRENNLIFSRVQNATEVAEDPMAIANNFYVDLKHPAGHVPVVASPINYINNPAEIKGPSPEIGQNTEEILLEMGFSWEDIAALKEKTVIL